MYTPVFQKVRNRKRKKLPGADKMTHIIFKTAGPIWCIETFPRAVDY